MFFTSWNQSTYKTKENTKNIELKKKMFDASGIRKKRITTNRSVVFVRITAYHTPNTTDEQAKWGIHQQNLQFSSSFRIFLLFLLLYFILFLFFFIMCLFLVLFYVLFTFPCLKLFNVKFRGETKKQQHQIARFLNFFLQFWSNQKPKTCNRMLLLFSNHFGILVILDFAMRQKIYF